MDITSFKWFSGRSTAYGGYVIICIIQLYPIYIYMYIILKYTHKTSILYIYNVCNNLFPNYIGQQVINQGHQADMWTPTPVAEHPRSSAGPRSLSEPLGAWSCSALCNRCWNVYQHLPYTKSASHVQDGAPSRARVNRWFISG